MSPGSQEFTEHDMKIYNRELGRLEISLKSALGSRLRASGGYDALSAGISKQQQRILEILKNSA